MQSWLQKNKNNSVTPAISKLVTGHRISDYNRVRWDMDKQLCLVGSTFESLGPW